MLYVDHVSGTALCFSRPSGAGVEATEAAPERISRGPRLVRAGRVLAARDNRRLSALAPVAGDAPRMKNGQKPMRGKESPVIFLLSGSATEASTGFN